MNRVEYEEGFTLIELVIVIMIMGIVMAVLIPQFTTMTLRARLGTDVDSVKTVQKQIEIYYVDNNHYPGSNVNDIMSTLISESYLNPKYLSGGSILLETKGATMVYDLSASQVKLKVTSEQYNIFNHKQDKSKWLSQ